MSRITDLISQIYIYKYINIYIVNGIKSNTDDIVKLGKGIYQLKRQIDYSSIFRLFKITDNSIFFEASSN